MGLVVKQANQGYICILYKSVHTGILCHFIHLFKVLQLASPVCLSAGKTWWVSTAFLTHFSRWAEVADGIITYLGAWVNANWHKIKPGTHQAPSPVNSGLLKSYFAWVANNNSQLVHSYIIFTQTSSTDSMLIKKMEEFCFFPWACFLVLGLD